MNTFIAKLVENGFAETTATRLTQALDTLSVVLGRTDKNQMDLIAGNIESLLADYITTEGFFLPKQFNIFKHNVSPCVYVAVEWDHPILEESGFSIDTGEVVFNRDMLESWLRDHHAPDLQELLDAPCNTTYIFHID